MTFMRSMLCASSLLKTVSVQKRTLATTIEAAPKVIPTTVQAFLRDFKTNEPTSLIELDNSVFGQPIRRDILHRVVVWQRDGMRQGTHSTKTRSEVRGTSKKLAPQKGRGKARIGDGKAPHIRGGGIAFGPKPRDHSTNLPRKVQELGLRVALSAKYVQDQLVVVESFSNVFKSEKPKTCELDRILKTTYNDTRKLLIVLNSCNPMIELAARNLSNCEVIHVEETNVLDLLAFDKLIIEKSAVQTLEEALKVEL
ncbi:ribosomal protein L4/L1 family-domain-containing protein [Cokeromyces recurvatus]|uniref:ribosomal protein L4/L1 family-domain-containing protein n=1 Tax=Cokeromyces recurvatus TaxID=90255 RepID=UPI00221E89BE|nr:ribosomal protein L4/L1 family-domain-containing protein [Cokeromyces recurvatus]KAI7903029.1 ribosomal protein L4/L1 family-domain-containing protein [Cokeromyces recurvatus]